MENNMAESKLGSKDVFVTLASVVITVLYPCLFFFFLNADLVFFNELVTPLGLFLLNAFLLFFLYYLILRNPIKAGLITNISMLCILFFKFIQDGINLISTNLFYWHVLMLVLSLIIGLLILVGKKMNMATSYKTNLAFLILFSVLTLINGISAAPAIINELITRTKSSEEMIIPTESVSSSNFYYFIFDEYGGLANLERFCGYDNSPFYHELEALGFNVSWNSSNETFKTNIEIPNLLSLKKVLTEDNYSNSIKTEILEDPFIFKFFQEHGYEVNLISDQSFIPSDNEYVDHFFSFTAKGEKFETIATLLIENSIYYPLQTKPADDRVKEINELFNYTLGSILMKPERVFTLGYYMLPHLPWVLDENGKTINGTDRTNWLDTNVYLGQLKYTTTKIKTIVKEIINLDPNAVIILQSDHGYRLPTHLEGWYDIPMQDEKLETSYQRSILNAVYYKGDTIDIESLSGINTLIKVINTLFSSNIDFVDSANSYAE